MIALVKIISKYRLEGIKAFVIFKLGRIPYMKFKDDTTITIYLSIYKQPIYLRRYTSDQAIFRQIFDANEYAIDYSFLPKVIIDAGANIGLATIYFSQRFPKAKIYSIEPEASNIEILNKNIRVYKQVRCLQKALNHTARETLDVIDEGIGKWGFVTKLATETTHRENIVSTI